MFGRSKPVVYDPYRGRRPRRGVPSWLVLLLAGLAAGAGGLFFLQERYLPPRLSPAESATLRSAYEAADAQAKRLQAELAAALQQRDGALAEGKRLASDLAGSRSAETDLRADLASLVATLPPDPRDNRVEVRAARFSATEGQLDYDVVLTRARSGGKPFTGVMQLSRRWRPRWRIHPQPQGRERVHRQPRSRARPSAAARRLQAAPDDGPRAGPRGRTGDGDAGDGGEVGRPRPLGAEPGVKPASLGGNQNSDLPVNVVNRSSAWLPASELPLGSSSGDQTHTPSCPGMWPTMPPPTPLLQGMPTR
jgi:hypothetical protein